MPPFLEIYLRFSSSIEKWLTKTIYVLLILLIMIQSILRVPNIRIWLTSVDRMEGIPYEYMDDSS